MGVRFLRYPTTETLLKNALGRFGPVEEQVKVSSLELQTPAGQVLRGFAKSSTGRGGESLRIWEDVVEPGLLASMAVQARLLLQCGRLLCT